MSTKIYYGYKINVKPENILNFCIKVRNKLQKFIDIDIGYISLEYEYEKFLYDIIGKPYNELELRTRYQKTFEEDVKYELAIIPKKDYCLCITYFKNRLYDSVFERLHEVEYYGYWDNTDPDENCKEEEWNQRRDDWECLSYGTPVCREALIYSPFTDYDYINLWYWEQPLNVQGVHEYVLRQYISNYIKNNYLSYIESYVNNLYENGVYNYTVRSLHDDIVDYIYKRLRWKLPLFTKEYQKYSSNIKQIWFYDEFDDFIGYYFDKYIEKI